MFPLAGAGGRRREPDVRATPMQVTATSWTVYFETQQGFGAIGWKLTQAEAVILANRIESGEVVI